MYESRLLGKKMTELIKKIPSLTLPNNGCVLTNFGLFSTRQFRSISNEPNSFRVYEIFQRWLPLVPWVVCNGFSFRFFCVQSLSDEARGRLPVLFFLNQSCHVCHIPPANSVNRLKNAQSLLTFVSTVTDKDVKRSWMHLTVWKDNARYVLRWIERAIYHVEQQQISFAPLPVQTNPICAQVSAQSALVEDYLAIVLLFIAPGRESTIEYVQHMSPQSFNVQHWILIWKLSSSFEDYETK